MEAVYRIRAMKPEEVSLAVDWAAEEGWNPGWHDAQSYLTADPEGFLVGTLNEEPIAAISAIKYSESFSFIGFYIVRKPYRGMGYGLKLWQAAMTRLAGCLIGLDGVVEQQANYRQSGFHFAYRNIRYRGQGGGRQQEKSILPAATVPFAQLDTYLQPFFPVERTAFFQAWFSQPDAVALVWQDVDRVAGCGVLRPCREGYKIGPLFADSADIAEKLFVALKSQVSESDNIYLDVPETNPAAVKLAQRYSMAKCFETARMYTGSVPDIALDRTFGVTSFEIG